MCSQKLNDAERREFEGLIDDVHEAQDVLIELETPKSTELRGRTAAKALKRIEEFLDTDQLYKAIEGCFVTTQGGETERELFRGAVQERLKIFERLAARNEDIDAAGRLENDYRWAYRRLATELFGHLKKHGRDLRGPSIFKLEPLKSFAKVNVEEEQPPAEASETETQEQRDSLEEIEVFDKFTDFVAGKLGSYRELSRLYMEIESRSEESVLLEIIQEQLEERPSLLLRLKNTHEVVLECEMLMEEPTRSVLALNKLYLKISALQDGAGQFSHNSFAQLLEEGLLGPEQIKDIITAGTSVANATDFVLGLAERFEERGVPANSDQFKVLNDAIRDLEAMAGATAKLHGPLKVLLEKGVGQIAHVENLSELALYGIKIENLINIPDRHIEIVAGIVGELKKGVFVADNKVGFVRAEIEATLESRLLLAQEFPQSSFDKAMDILKEDYADESPQLRRAALEILTVLSSHYIQEEETSAQCSRTSADILKLCEHPGMLVQCASFMRKPTRHAAVPELQNFISDLAALNEGGVLGIENLVQDAYLVWKAEHAGDRTQDLSGFLVEADTASKLIGYGFRIDSVATPGERSDFAFDALGSTSKGRAIAIETKRSLSTLSAKETEELERSQIVRFTRASAAEGRTPVIAIASLRDEDSWAFAHLRSIFVRMRDELGIKRPPVLIDVERRKEISI